MTLTTMKQRSAFVATAMAGLVWLAACATPAPPVQVTALPQSSTHTPAPTRPALTLTNDFDPPIGRPALPAPRESPGEFRLLTATSSDGKSFRPTGRIVLDQANVPDLVMGENGLVYLYFTGWQTGDKRNVTAAAISPDAGRTWYFKHLSFAGLDANRPGPVDPDMVRLADGTWRLYATTSLDNRKLGIVSMDSRDGLHFGPAATAFALDTNVIDSTTIFFKGVWHMFTLDGDKPEQWQATKSGAEFALSRKTVFVADGAGYIASNGIAVNDGYRLFGFSVPRKNLRAFFSTDGMTWLAEPGVPLACDPNSPVESEYIKDPAVVQLPDGSYLMVYVTKIP